MTEDKFYRLGRYKIIEKPSGELCWKSYGGFSSVKGGKCFIEGDILFLGAGETKEHGYLILEFKEHLDQLPRWEKTKYYSPSYTIYSCKTGRRCLLEEREKKLDKKRPRIRTNVYAEVTRESRGVAAKHWIAPEVVINIRRRSAEILELFRDWLSKIRS
ncbi:MAG: hypothetical protein P8075_11370 [Deltaproteobacteria bacterium]|jgi:hypothetical protein